MYHSFAKISGRCRCSDLACAARLLLRTLFVSLLFVLGAAGSQAAEGDAPLNLRVEIDGQQVRVDLDILLPATPAAVWDLLTDFEHMPAYLSNVKSSRILSRQGAVLHVLQTGVTNAGPITFEFESEREMTLTPRQRIDTRMLRGNLKQFTARTELVPENGKTRLRFHSDAESDRWIPPIIGRNFIESEIQEHYREIQQELRRRQTARSG